MASLNERVKKLTYVDLKLIQVAILIIGIGLVKLFPQVLGIRLRYLIALLVIACIKPLYKFWIKK